MDLDHEIIGLIAGFLTTFAFLPQFIKTWRSQSTKDISYGMYFTFCLGVTIWLYYGCLIGSLSVIVANCLTLIMSLAILIMKLYFEKSKKS